MDARFSVFLAAARWASALAVVAYHLRFLVLREYDDSGAGSLPVQAFYFVTGLGQEAFAVFFVIEGITAARLFTQPSFTVTAEACRARLLRLYAFYLPALLLGALLDLVGTGLAGQQHLYARYEQFDPATLDLRMLVANALMLQPFFAADVGSNQMLHLFAYLFWVFLLAETFLHARNWRKPVRIAVRIALPMLAIVLMPQPFLVWSAVWLLGAGVVYHARAGLPSPRLPIALALLAIITVTSRILGAEIQLLPPPLGQWLVEWRHFLVGLGVASVALACTPVRAARSQERPAGDARFLFFFHFPIMMLSSAALLACSGVTEPMRPSAQAFALFFGILTASCVLCVVVGRALRRAGDALRRLLS